MARYHCSTDPPAQPTATNAAEIASTNAQLRAHRSDFPITDKLSSCSALPSPRESDARSNASYRTRDDVETEQLALLAAPIVAVKPSQHERRKNRRFAGGAR